MSGIPQYCSFKDLVAAGVLNNRQTLLRWQRTLKFPRPVKLGPNSAKFLVDDVQAWLASRGAPAMAPQPANDSVARP